MLHKLKKKPYFAPKKEYLPPDSHYFKCDDCDYVSNKKISLKVHVQSKHEGVRYPCDLCDYQATQRGRLRVHMLENIAEFSFLVKSVHLVFFTKTELRDHIRSVHGNNPQLTLPYRCNLCDNKTGQSAKTQTHLACHANFCDVCDIVAISRKLLKIHKTLHQQRGVWRFLREPQKGLRGAPSC